MDKNENEKGLPEEADKECGNDDIFAIEEVKVEEMAIDGICGVY